MPRVHYVKSARKDNIAVRKGEPYYWWQNFRSPKRFSKTYPRGSQLCTGRKSEVMAAQEALTDDLMMADTAEQIKDACETCAETFRQLASEYEESADNMPESLQYGEQAENMREMAASLETQADELENLDFDPPHELEPRPDRQEPEEDDFDSEDEFNEAWDDWDFAGSEWDDRNDENESHIEQLKEDAQFASDEVEFLF